MATDKKKFARPSDSMVAQLKDMIQKYGPKAKVYDPDALEAARAAVKEPQNYGADEFRIIMADLKAAAAQNFAVEDRFYFKGKKEKFQLPNAEAYKQKELLRTATVNANNLTHQLFGLGQTIKSTGEQAQRMSQHYQTLIQDAQTPKEMAMVAAEIVKYAGKMARDLSASLREPIK